MKKILYFLLTLFLTAITTQAQTINVPGDQPTIQSAINISMDGDTVLVADGTYFENINFSGKAITVASHFLIDGNETHIDSTIINGSQPTHPDSGTVVSIISGEDTTSVLHGFTITGGSGNYTTVNNIRGPGGIGIAFSGAKIVHNKIVNNTVYYEHPLGGGIAIQYPTHPIIITNNYIAFNKAQSTHYQNLGGGIVIAFDTEEYVLIANNVITNNTVSTPGNTENARGGGISVWYSNSVISNNLIINNHATHGGGIHIENQLNGLTPTIINNTIAYNTATDFGGGIGSDASCIMNLMNCIIWGNTAPIDSQIHSNIADGLVVQYSDIEGGYIGIGNIDFDPQFSDTTNCYLSPTSPCVDAGNPEGIFNDLTDPDNPGFPLFPAMGGLRNDMGAYGGSPFMISAYNPEIIILNCSLNDTYQVPGTDTLIVITEISSPENQFVNVKAIVENYDASISDTIPMFDDGTNNDNIAGDGFYTAFWPIINNEDNYQIHISTYLSDYEYLVRVDNAARFTTKGPIIFEDLEITSPDTVTNPGDRIKFSLTLKSLGITDTVYDVGVNIIITDTTIRNTTLQIPLFGDIAPGESLTNTSRDFALTFNNGEDSCSVGLYEFGLEITSNGTVFWYDTFTIDVESITGIEDESANLPKEFTLGQNYPNPFNPNTKINYSIPSHSYVTLKVFDVLGREVSRLVNKEQPQGNYEIEFDGSDLTSGIYFYRIQAGDYVDTKKMVLLR